MMAQVQSISKKSVSGSKPPPRLSRTLKRNPKFRDFIGDDLKYLWVAYKKGDTTLPKDMSPKEFDIYTVNMMLSEYEFGWTFIENNTPIGFIFGIKAGPLVLVGDVIWLPMATERNKVEHIVNYINVIRRQMKIIFYTSEKWKKFYLYVAKLGITKRIGNIQDMSEPLTLWESRWAA